MGSRRPGAPAARRAARPSYRQIWMADGVSPVGPDMLAAAAGGFRRAQVSGRPRGE